MSSWFLIECLPCLLSPMLIKTRIFGYPCLRAPSSPRTPDTDKLSAGPMVFWACTSGSPYLHVLCQPLEDSLQRKEDFINVLNGPILVTINKKLSQSQIVLLYKNLFMKFTLDTYISSRSAFMVNSIQFYLYSTKS